MNRRLLLALQVYLWYPLSLITGGTTAKIMVAAKDNFLGKYIYKDTLARNLAAVIYKVSIFPSGCSNSRSKFNDMCSWPQKISSMLRVIDALGTVNFLIKKA